MPHYDKIIFLDFDGVLNCATWFSVTSKRKYKKARGKAKADLKLQAKNAALAAIDPAAVMLINSIIQHTSAVVCVSSTWRLNFTVTELQDMLELRGFKGKVIGRTPNAIVLPVGIEKYERGHEIQSWLDNNSAGSFCIIDDSNDMAHLLPKLVQTEWIYGLQPQHADMCIDLLNNSSSVK